MNKKIVIGLGILLMPIGAVLLSACGPAEDVNNAELVLDEAADRYWFPQIPFSEYGLCNDGWDNDGNGLADMADAACHVLHPVRDLSLFPAPLGNNFAPDISLIPAGGPGMPGGFRDRDQITRWMRFLTDTNGYTAGIDLFGAAMDSPAVPVPVPLFPKVLQGTAAQGNNNNIDGVAIPGNALIPLPAVGVAAPVVGAAVVGAAVGVQAVGGIESAPAVEAAPTVGLSDSYKAESFQGHGPGFGHRAHHATMDGRDDKKVGDRRASYGNPRSVLGNYGGQSNMFQSGANTNSFYREGSQNNMFQQRANGANGNNYGYNGSNGTTSNMNGFKGASLPTSDFGAPGDWPKGNAYTQNSSFPQGNSSDMQSPLGRQGNAYGQPNGYGRQGNAYGQPSGFGPQGNAYGQPSGFGPQGNAYGQPEGYGRQGNAYGQPNGFGPQGGSWPQGNAYGRGYGRQGNSYGQPNGLGTQGAWPQGQDWGRQGSWPSAR